MKIWVLAAVSMFALGGCMTSEVARVGPVVISAGANAQEVALEAKAETSQLITWACGVIPFVPGC